MPATLTKDAGKFRYLGRLYKLPDRSDFDGGSDAEPVEIRKLWLRLWPIGASEQNDGDKITPVERYELRAIWSPEPIDASMYIKTPRHTLEIESVENIDEADEEYRIVAIKTGAGHG